MLMTNTLLKWNIPDSCHNDHERIWSISIQPDLRIRTAPLHCEERGKGRRTKGSAFLIYHYSTCSWSRYLLRKWPCLAVEDALLFTPEDASIDKRVSRNVGVTDFRTGWSIPIDAI
jgi:hypothetical protein